MKSNLADSSSCDDIDQILTQFYNPHHPLYTQSQYQWKGHQHQMSVIFLPELKFIQ